MSAPAQQTISGDAFVMGGLTTQIYGIVCATKPATTPAPADFGHDPSHNFERLAIRNARDAAIKLIGRSDIRLSGIVIEQSWGIGIDTTFDTTIANSFVGFTAWDGIRVGGSSCRISNTKTYNAGQRIGGGGGFNMASGISANGVSGITITGHDAQQCSGSAFRFTNCRAINVDGVASQAGFQGVGSDGTTLAAAAGAYGLELDAVTASIFHLVGLANPGGRAYRLVRSDGNEIHITHVGSGTSVAGPTESADTVRAGNEIHVNGQATAAVSYGGMYGRVTTAGLWYCPGIQETSNIAPTQNVVHLVPVPLARPGVTVVELSLRVVKAGSAGAALRLGYYTSDLSGNDTFLLAAELPIIDGTIADVHRRGTPAAARGARARGLAGVRVAGRSGHRAGAPSHTGRARCRHVGQSHQSRRLHRQQRERRAARHVVRSRCQPGRGGQGAGNGGASERLRTAPRGAHDGTTRLHPSGTSRPVVTHPSARSHGVQVLAGSHSLRAVSGPVRRARSGSVEAIDREGRDEPACDEQVVLRPGGCSVWSSWARRNKAAAPSPASGGDDDADEQRHGRFQGDDPAQHGQRDAGEAQQAERSSALGQPAGDAHREAASGDRQAGEQHDVGELPVVVELPRASVS